VVVGETVILEELHEEHGPEVEELDWQRALHPAMAGPLTGGRLGATTFVARPIGGGSVVAILDAVDILGYPGVRNVSIYADRERTAGPIALEAYGRFVLHQLDAGARLIHHEVLALNQPVHRLFRGLGLEATARLRDHAYVAGRHWDVLVYSYGRDQLDSILARVFPRGHRSAQL
jgi:RimJ/RimL family protein N-acetyltransferase